MSSIHGAVARIIQAKARRMLRSGRRWAHRHPGGHGEQAADGHGQANRPVHLVGAAVGEQGHCRTGGDEDQGQALGHRLTLAEDLGEDGGGQQPAAHAEQPHAGTPRNAHQGLPSAIEHAGPVRVAALDDLHAHRCIPIRERDQDFGRWELDGPEGRVAIKVSGPLSANNGEIVRQWAIDGHGIILRSTWDIGDEIDSGVLVPVLPGYIQQADVWAVYPSRLSVSAKVKVCVEFLEAWFAQTGMNDVP